MGPPLYIWSVKNVIMWRMTVSLHLTFLVDVKHGLSCWRKSTR